MKTRIVIGGAAIGMALALTSATCLAQGTGNSHPLPPVPHNQVTPKRYMQHPRPVPETTTTEALNAMSLKAAQSGTTFTPPPPGNEHQKAGTGM